MANHSISSPIALDNQVRVSTPENISFQYEITGPARRLFAYLADVAITITAFALIAFVGAMLFALIASLLQGIGVGPMLTVIAEIANGVLLALAFLSLWFYGAYMETYFNGQTWGKMIANIRTISVDGSSIDGSQATLRNFFRLLDVSPFISLGLLFGPDFGYQPILPIFAFGLISMIISPKFQRVGDLVAGTMVVTEEKKWVHSLATFQDPRVPKLAELIPDHFIVNRSLARTLAEYVDRRRILPPQRVSEVAEHLGKPLLETMGLPQDTNSDLLLCALYYKTFIGSEEKDESYNPFSELLAQESAEGTKVVQK